MVPLGQVGPVGLPERGDLMLLMPILPMMLIGTILVAGALDRRGLFGEPRRKVAVGVCALIGIVGNGVALGLWLAGQTVGLPFVSAGISTGIGLRDIFAGSFELALIIALVPTLYPSLAARLADRQMQVPRAFVLAGFCVAATCLFTSLALVGG